MNVDHTSCRYADVFWKDPLMSPRVTVWLRVQVSHGLAGPFLRRAGLGKGFLEAAWSGKAHCGMVQWGPACAKSPWLEHTPLSGGGSEGAEGPKLSGSPSDGQAGKPAAHFSLPSTPTRPPASCGRGCRGWPLGSRWAWIATVIFARG